MTGKGGSFSKSMSDLVHSNGQRMIIKDEMAVFAKMFDMQPNNSKNQNGGSEGQVLNLSSSHYLFLFYTHTHTHTHIQPKRRCCVTYLKALVTTAHFNNKSIRPLVPAPTSHSSLSHKKVNINYIWTAELSQESHPGL